MRIEIEHGGDVRVSRELLRFSDRTQDASPAFRSIARLLRDSESKQFKTQGRHASGGWAKLAPSTIASKRRDPKAKYKRAILRRTGALMDSLTKKTGASHTEQVSRDELVFGTTVPYAKFHQFGTGQSRTGGLIGPVRKRMPRRRPLEVRGRDRTEIVKRLQQWIVTGKVRDMEG